MAEKTILDFQSKDGMLDFTVTYDPSSRKLYFYGDLEDIPPVRVDYEPDPDEVWTLIDSYIRDLELMEKKRKYQTNPRKRGVKIYDTILAIEARKGEDSLWPGEDFRHDFSPKTKAEIIGNPDGSLTIRSKVGKRLWKKFNYSEEDI